MYTYIYIYLRRCLAWFGFSQKLKQKVTTSDGPNIHIYIHNNYSFVNVVLTV